MQNLLRSAILRTLAFQASWRYAPTRLQLFFWLDPAETTPQPYNFQVFTQEVESLLEQKIVAESHNRIALASHQEIIQTGKANERYFPRKLKKARFVASYLRHLPWIRAICLCNTMALGQSKDQSDLDFFIICKAGSIWRTRFFSALPFKLFGARPGESSIDPVCLSFFITDNALNLSGYALEDDDPYFRYWFLALLPLYNDGVLNRFWYENKSLRGRHPNSKPWIALDKGTASTANPATLMPITQPSFFEKHLRQVQSVRFPKELAYIANQDTRVMINDNVLKFHVTDNRLRFRKVYHQICHDLNIHP